MNSNVIYKYGCNIGETKGHLLVHQYEYLDRKILTEKPLNTMKKMLLPLESIAISKIIQLILLACPWLGMWQIITILN